MGRTCNDQEMFGDCSLNGTPSSSVFLFLRTFYLARYKLDEIRQTASKKSQVTQKTKKERGKLITCNFTVFWIIRKQYPNL